MADIDKPQPDTDLGEEPEGLDLAAAEAAAAAADRHLSREDVAMMQAGMQAGMQPGAQLSPPEPPVTREMTGAAALPGIESLPPLPTGQLRDLHFVDRGTGVPLAQRSIDPFAALGPSPIPPWPYEGDDIPVL
jgi:hypothetical protein